MCKCKVTHFLEYFIMNIILNIKFKDFMLFSPNVF